ncbi:FecR domain-containing protein [Algoriphagus halophytocola]|uniref:FecR domain-containing protein n=1 Tax=Algoriphagus halophytocola TaxID=2991499 RepID=A0ABY6MH14_9BACT|nr:MULTISPECIES: FecR domain-containing protein [unclassified Algoriphagus]UZD23075.1 FecR domain-containing protein [Algoriphagus sp. TR-M5]WBL44367.1 FecR domain-containing protein [Algoriphagus sp. TR-M9]
MDKEILIRFLNGVSTPEEAAQVVEWLDMPGSRAKLDQLLEESWESAPESNDTAALERIHTSIHSKLEPPKKTAWIGWNSMIMKVAALVVLFCSLIFSLFRWSDQPDTEIKEDLKIYTRNTQSGEKLRIRLPDQSYVILNSNSSLTFDSEYGKELRKISLEGEAFFEVASNKDVPFIVHSGELQTTALGTAFNVSFRKGKHQVALTEGKVKVQLLDKGQTLDDQLAKFLDPGTMASYDSEGKEFEVAAFDPVETTAWKEGRIRFKRKRLQDILGNLQDWYGVEITVHRSVQTNRRVSGEFNNESLENILEGLSFSLDFNYSINENQVTLK